MGELFLGFIILILAMGMSRFPAGPKQNLVFLPKNTQVPTRILTRTPTPTIPGPPVSPTGTRIPSPTTAASTPTPTPLRRTLASSKLGIFMLYSSNGGKEIIRAGPQVVKVIDPHTNPEVMQRVREYKQMFPSGIVVMRIWQGTDSLGPYTVASNANTAADEFWALLKNALDTLPVSDKGLIDYLSGPNEFGNDRYPFFWDAGMPAWTNTFWLRLMANMSSPPYNGAPYKFKPLLGDIQMGWPNPIDSLSGMLPALTDLARRSGVFSYHAYTKDLNDFNDLSANNQDFALRYRRIYDYFNSQGLGNIKMMITEGGYATDTFAGYCTVTNGQALYQSWLPWFDQQLKANSYIIGGVTLFQIGDSGTWNCFNIESLAPWLRDYLVASP